MSSTTYNSSAHTTEVHDSTKSHHTRTRGDFLVRVVRSSASKAWASVRDMLTDIIFTVKMIVVTASGVLMFIFGFPISMIIMGIIMPPLMVYLIGKYLTLLPMYIVIILVVLTLFPTKKAVFPFLGLSVFLGFFMVFLV